MRNLTLLKKRIYCDIPRPCDLLGPYSFSESLYSVLWVNSCALIWVALDPYLVPISKERRQKKNFEKAVRLTALGGGVTPLQPDQNYL